MKINEVVGIVVALVLIVTLLIPFSVVKNDTDTLNVIVIDGQSNGAYWSVCDPEVVQRDYDEVPKHNLYYYGTDTTPIIYDNGNYDESYKSYDIHSIWDDGWKIGGYEPILANELSNRSNRDTLVINVAIPGFSVANLEPTGVGGIFGFNAIEDALSKINGYDHINFVGWIWIQGEADKLTPVNAYKYGFQNIENKFSELDFKNCYVVGVRDSYGGNSQIALTEIAETDPNVKFVTDIAETFTEENGLLSSGDPIHFSQEGRDVIAKILGDEIPIRSNGETPVIISNLIGVIPIFVIIGLIVTLVAVLIVRQRRL